MLLSAALIIMTSLLLTQIFIKLKLPGLIGMLVSGIILGPYVLNLIDPSILSLSTDLRQIALIVILVRAGLSLDLKDLNEVGRPALLLSFIPATIEMIAIIIFAPIFFQISYIEAAILGAIVAAVSPAIVVPRVLKLMKTGYGKDKKIPQLILASASIDDVYVIILFTSFIHAYTTSTFNLLTILLIPIAIILGVLLGIIIGSILVWIFKKFHIRDTLKVLIIFSAAFLLIVLEHILSNYVPVSGLLAVIVLGGTILKQYDLLAQRLVIKFEKIWVIAEIMLFVLVGAAVDIRVLSSVGLFAFILIMIAIIFRMLGVIIALIKSNLNNKEKLFVGFAYSPKATVQAAIGAIPLALGIPSGHLILSIAVLAILITAPFGAIMMDSSYLKLLKNS
ncbi:cation:proton antiporter [Peloplasma aerotolerans]|uniref:Cation:proton antiporter n=1 Tax=Peloplasma aerotolerans TaxID=3044389 RepID=A0AAW6UA05_9MOLU|nr:cation:proton antiporter [Mariniplasma sp. M4Ah]MDI6453003.1 cation:proton antiporter [Mariniplasma sp. M4Ah]